MKTTKIAIIATIITTIIICSCAYAIPVKAESRPEFYPKLSIVIDTHKVAGALWVIDCLDKEGNKWSFYDDEGTWTKGDIANLLMWALNEHEEEDEVVEVYWEGYTKNVTEWLQNNGWR